MGVFVGHAEFAYNSSVNRSTGRSLFSVLCRRAPRHVVAFVVPPAATGRSSAAYSMTADHTDIFRQVLEALQARVQEYKATVHRHKRHQIFQEGDPVMVHLRRERRPAGIRGKLQPRHLGPF